MSKQFSKPVIAAVLLLTLQTSSQARTSTIAGLKTAGACNDEYKANKGALKNAKEKKKDVIAACRALPPGTPTPIGTATAPAAPASAPTAAPAPAPAAPHAQPATAPTAPTSATSAGAVAFSRTGEPATGEFEDAVVLRTFGEVPSLEELLSGA